MIIPLSRPDCKYLSAVATKLPQALITPAAAVVLSFGNDIRSFALVHRPLSTLSPGQSVLWRSRLFVYPFYHIRQWYGISPFCSANTFKHTDMIRQSASRMRCHSSYDTFINMTYFLFRQDLTNTMKRRFLIKTAVSRLYLKVLRSCALHYEI